jgi:hypothetical protein
MVGSFELYFDRTGMLEHAFGSSRYIRDMRMEGWADDTKT